MKTSTAPAAGSETVRELPRSLREIASIVGLDATLALVERWGGQRLYVPGDVDGEHELALIIGLDHAQALAAEYSRTYIQIPRASDLIRLRRDQEIRARHAAGNSQAKLASEYLLTERQIWNITSR